MNSEIIKQFLVGIGFQVDDASFQKFNQGLKAASKNVLALYATIKVAAAGIFYAFSQSASGIEQLGYELRLVAPQINRVLYLRRELLRSYAKAGVDIRATVQQAIKFNMALQKTKFALQAVYTSVAAKFFPVLTQQMEKFRKQIFDNMPRIQRALEKFVTVIFRAFEATTLFTARVWSILSRIYAGFKQLHDLTNGWSTAILGLIVAWRTLNLAFLASPIGLIFAALVALIGLYDDFMTYTEGGESFFDWSGAIEPIKKVQAWLESIKKTVEGLVDVFGNLALAVVEVFRGNFTIAFQNFKNMIQSIVTLLQSMFDIGVKAFGAFASILETAASGVAGLFGFGEDVDLKGIKNPPPLGAAQAANSATNQNVNQQTTINVSGVADAKAAGSAVASQQNGVNRNLTRNLKATAR